MSTSVFVSLWNIIKRILRAALFVGILVFIIAMLPSDVMDKIENIYKAMLERFETVRTEWREIWGDEKVDSYIDSIRR